MAAGAAETGGFICSAGGGAGGAAWEDAAVFGGLVLGLAPEDGLAEAAPGSEKVLKDAGGAAESFLRSNSRRTFAT